MSSYLARLGLSDLMDEKVGDKVEKDKDTVPTDPGQKKEMQWRQRSNKKAAGILLNSILTSTDGGKAAFYLIGKFHTDENGFSGGHFYWEWSALVSRYEDVEEKTLSQLRKEYCNMRMEETENPSLFVVDMERKCIKLNKKGYKIEKEAFLEDLLEALPENQDPKIMNPHQMEKRLLKDKLKNAKENGDRSLSCLTLQTRQKRRETL